MLKVLLNPFYSGIYFYLFISYSALFSLERCFSDSFLFLFFFFFFLTLQILISASAPEIEHRSGSNAVRLKVGAKAANHLQNKDMHNKFLCILLSRYSDKRKYFELPVALESKVRGSSQSLEYIIWQPCTKLCTSPQ